MHKKKLHILLLRRGAIGVTINAAVVAHHLLELLEVDVAVTVGIHGLDHAVAFFDGALQAEAVQDEVELCGGDEAVFVLVVQVEGVAELRGASVGGVGAAEGGKLGEADEAIMVGV
ncbi:hypothetical protein PIB30_010958 [Stylosanthes scabra]|uniref:Uncharacterized protein n=1 Tax=Stylosanthes scabra TaxID=79078 RepID=A0ABU6U4D4_9FABA|nr:hypothetical protein [Stylosanthes scabra]